jgi:hypothetical protein
VLDVAWLETWLRTGAKSGIRRRSLARRRNNFRKNSRVFYTVQSEEDERRLRGDGTPWPTDPTRAHLGEGIYSWDSRKPAEMYKRSPKRSSIICDLGDSSDQMASTFKYRLVKASWAIAIDITADSSSLPTVPGNAVKIKDRLWLTIVPKWLSKEEKQYLKIGLSLVPSRYLPTGQAEPPPRQ